MDHYTGKLVYRLLPVNFKRCSRPSTETAAPTQKDTRSHSPGDQVAQAPMPLLQLTTLPTRRSSMWFRSNKAPCQAELAIA